MPVVTIRGQLGSGAPEIGKLIAAKLSAEYVDGEITEKVAELLNCREPTVATKEMPPGSLLTRMATALGHSPQMVVDSGVACLAYVRTLETSLDDTRYLETLKSITRELAMTESIVIRGRGSQFILKNWPGAFHVLFVAPLKLRVRRVMIDMKVDEESARKEIERFDSSRRQFIKRYFKAELEDPMHYHMVINTERLSFETAALTVVRACLLMNMVNVA